MPACRARAAIFLMLQAALLSLVALRSTHAEITLDGTLGPAGALAGPDFVIPDTVGTRLAANLFHSFAVFDVFAGESATFTGPEGIERVISRVTGGGASTIDGLLRSTVPSADFYLINPNGVVLGEQASLEVQGSFYASTADRLRFADGGVFDATEPRQSVLSVAHPTAFGFVRAAPARLAVSGSALEVPAAHTLSLVGGQLSIENATLLAPGGRVDLASVAGPSDVMPNPPGVPPGLDVEPAAKLAAVTLAGTDIDAGGEGGGTVFVRGSRFTAESSNVFASVKADAGPGQAHGRGVDIRVTDDIVLVDSEIGASVFPTVAQDSGGVRARAARIDVVNAAAIESNAAVDSTGDGGAIEIETDELYVSDGGVIRSVAAGSGESGDIVVRAGVVEVRDGGFIFSRSPAGTGKAGDIDIEASELLELVTTGPFTAITSRTFGGSGRAGDVRASSKKIQIQRGTELSSVTFGPGPGGNVIVAPLGDTLALTIDGDGAFGAGIFATSFDTGPGGDVQVGAAALPATEVRVVERGQILAQAFGAADSGNIVVHAKHLTLTEGAQLRTSTLGFAGFGPGRGGDIEIDAENVSISGFVSTPDPFGNNATGIFAFAANGSGRIHISATDAVSLTNRGAINVTTAGPGAGGLVDVRAQSLRLSRGAQMLSSTFGTGPAGDIRIEADDVLISGVHPEPFVAPLVGGTQLAPSSIGSQTAFGGGDAGEVDIAARRLRVLDGAVITTETFGPGNAGSIRIEADNIFVAGLNESLLNFLAGQGMDTTEATALASAAVRADSVGAFMPGIATGQGGAIAIRGGTLVVTESGRLLTRTSTPGRGGNIDLDLQRLTVSQEGEISAESTGTGDAGRIRIAAEEEVRLVDGGEISTESVSSDGGNIDLSAGRLVFLSDGQLTTSVGTGRGRGGNVLVDPLFIVLRGSRIQANAFGGPGGNIRLVASEGIIVSSDSVISASSALSTEGAIELDSPDTDVAADIAVLPEFFLDVRGAFRSACEAQRLAGGANSLEVAGRGSLPVHPDGYLPSFAIESSASESQAALRPAPAQTARDGALISLAAIGCGVTGRVAAPAAAPVFRKDR